MTYSENVATFRINVRDDVEDGKLVATCTLVSGVREFVNRYDSGIPTDKLVEPHFTKKLEGRDWRDGDAFTFEITAKTDGAPLPVDASGNVVTTVTVRSAAEATYFTFGTIPFTYDMVRDGARDFTYEIRELASNIAGVTDDPRVATLTVHVSDDGAGTMSAHVTNENNTFTNTYHSQLDYTAAGGLSVTKTMSGRAMSAGEFGFDVIATGDGDKLGIAGHHTNDEASDGAETLVVSSPAGVTFTQEDVGKTYSYTITESGGSLGGVTYDATSYNVTITTADDPSTAKLTVTTHVTSTSGTDETYTYVAGTDANVHAKVSFENSYAADGKTDPIVGTKTMANGLMLDGDFSFRLAYAADKNDVVATATNQHRQVNFGTLSYDSAMLATLVSKGKATRTDDGWTIPYVAYEVTDGLTDRGVTPSLASFSLNVRVRDNGKGKLECALELPASGLAFSNTYATGDSASVSLAGTKVLSVPEGLAGTDIAGKFEFTVTTDEPGAPMPEHTTASNDATGNVNFGSITFRLEDLLRALGEDGGAETGAEAGALAEQREENPTAATTAPNAEANADAAPVSDGSSAAGDVAATLAPEASAGAPGAASAPAADPTPTAPAAPAESESDSDTASDGAAEAQIETLALHSPDEAQVAVAAWRTSRQTLRTVSDVALSATDAPTRERTHTFHYVVSESGSVAGVTNDATPSRDVYIKVTDDGNGKLTAQRVDANGNAVNGPAFSFTNRYSVVPTTSNVTDQITVHKKLTGRTLMAGEFTFELVEDGRVVATGTNDADGSVSLGTITYTEPGTHIYTIRERGHGTIANGVTYSNASYQVKTVVSDNHDGTLAVEHSLMADADVAEFENTYEAKPTTLALSATKILDGATLEAGQFTFRLIGGGIDLTATNDATGQVTFREMLLSKAGTYTFTISEVNDGQDNVTYDTATHKVTVAVTDDGQGSLVVSVNREDLAGCTFRNTYTPPATPTPEPSTPKTPEAPKPTKVVPQTGDTFDVTPIAVAATIGVVLIALAVVLRKRS